MADKSLTTKPKDQKALLAKPVLERPDWAPADAFPGRPRFQGRNGRGLEKQRPD